MAPSLPSTASTPSPGLGLWPLENGDRLTRVEFERRYETMTHVHKAELIEGVVYVPSPVRQRWHGRPHAHLITWLGHYEASTPGVELGDNSTIRLDLDNEPQPDALLLLAPEHGGQTHIDAEGFIVGAPEFIAEVAASSASYDVHTKLHVYRRNGVREYLVWRVLDQEVDWLVLRSGQYEPLPLEADGVWRSESFLGLWLDPGALLQGALARVLAVGQQGLASAEHTAFLRRLGGAARSV